MFYLTVDSICKHVGFVPGLKIKFSFSFILFTLLGIIGRIVYFNSKQHLKNRNNIHSNLQAIKDMIYEVHIFSLKLFISTGLFFRLFISAHIISRSNRLFISAHIIFKSKSFYLKVCALMYVYVILTYIVKIILSLNEFHHAHQKVKNLSNLF
jgi:magnesium-transporting ATPase (P-type)